jgi:hypothetical protein
LFAKSVCMRLLVFIMLLLCSALAGAVPTGIPYELGGKGCFAEEPGLKPLYFCQCVDVPVMLPPEHPDQLIFQLIGSIVGISRHEKTGEVVLRKIAVFQTVSKSGQIETRHTDRIIDMGKAPAGPISEMTSHEPAHGSDWARTTALHLDPRSDKGTLRVQLWKGADRQKKPFFDHIYHIRYRKL